MIVVDDQISYDVIIAGIASWYPGAVVSIRDSRPRQRRSGALGRGCCYGHSHALQIERHGVFGLHRNSSFYTKPITIRKYVLNDTLL